MPKIIAELEKTIKEKTKVLLFENGYSNLTIRQIAQDCNMAAGTMYNYFKSKEYLVAAIILDDWLSQLQKLNKTATKAKTPIEGIKAIYSQLIEFYGTYDKIWSDYSMNSDRAFPSKEKHILLVSQISSVIKELLERFDYTDPVVFDFLSEWLLFSANNKMDFDKYLTIIEKIINKETK